MNGQFKSNICNGCLKLYYRCKLHTYCVHISFKRRVEKDNIDLSCDDISLNTNLNLNRFKFGANWAVVSRSCVRTQGGLTQHLKFSVGRGESG